MAISTSLFYGKRYKQLSQALAEVATEDEADHKFDHKNKILFAKWNDNNVVTMGTNFDTVEPMKYVKRWSKQEQKKINIPQPNLLANYNMGMGGVDLHDQAVNVHKIGIRGKKWWWSLFTSMMSSTFVNAWKLYKDVNNSTKDLKEFKNPDLEKNIVEKGGSKIKLPCETRWCSHRDAFKCLVKNIHLMRQVAAEKTIKANIFSLLFDSEFLDDIKNKIILLNGICNIINKCQSSKCSVAEAVEMWIDLKLPEKFSTKLKFRQDMAMNKYALTAFYLHPFMDKSNEQDSTIFDFLVETLDGSDLEEWECYRHKRGFFQKLYEKNIKNPLTFWGLAEKKFPCLANLANKLLQIPASSAQIERLFSSWGHVHCAARNRLTFQRSKKLLHIFYSLKIIDDQTAEDEEEADEN